MRRARYRGDFHPELEDALIQELELMKARDPFAPATVLCPTSLLRQHLLRVSTERTGGFCNVRFLTLGHYRDRLAAPRLADRGITPAPRGAAEAVIARLVREGGLDGSDLAPIARRAGFASSAAQTIRDLREAGISASTLAAAGRDHPRWRTLALVLGAIEESFRGVGWADDAAIWELAAVEAGRDAPGAVLLYGFYDLAPRQWELIRAIAAGEHDVVAFVPEGPAEAFRFAAEFGSKLESLGLRDIACPARDDPIAPTLRALRERLFAPEPSGDPAPDDSLRIIAAPGEAREAREVARAVLDAVRELDVPFREVAILGRGDELTDELLEAFDAAGIPVAARGPRASVDPGLRALRLLCEVARTGLGRAATAELLTAGVLDPVALVGTERARGFAPSAWDALTRRLGIVRGAADFRRKLGARERTGASLEQIEALRAAIDAIERALRAIPERASLCRFADAFDACRSLLGPAASGSPCWASALGTMRALDPVAGEVELDDVVRLIDDEGDEPSESERAEGDLDPKLPRSERGGRGGPRPTQCDGGRIVVQELMSARGVPFDVVVVPRLSERAFPRPVRSDPLLSDDDRAELARRTGRPIPIKSRSADEERLLFRLAVGAARKRLVLTYPRLDPERGTARAPSLYVFEALEAIRGVHVGEASLASDRAVERVPLSRLHPSAPERILDPREWIVRELDEAIGRADPGRAGAALATYPHARAGIELDRARFDSRRLTEYDGLLVSGEARAIAARALDRAALSASRLERWASCPFRFLMSHVLGIEKLEEPEAEQTADPADRGSVVHRILQRFVEGWIGAADRGSFVDCKARLERIAAEELDLFERERPTGAAILWSAEKKEILSDLALWLERELEGGGRLPVSAELEFGPGSDAPPVLLEAGGRSFQLVGRIDRIDLSADRSSGLVVDYKTGKPDEDLKADSLLGGRALQLAIYVLAARAHHPEVRRWTAVYDHLSRSRGLKRIGWDAGEDGERLGDLATAVRLITEGVDAGLFLQDSSSCRGCQLEPACSPAVGLIAERKQGDERREPFVRLRELP